VQRASTAGEAYHAPNISPREARVQSLNNSGGNRGFTQSARNQPARNGGSFNDRGGARPGNREQMSRGSSRDRATPARTERPNRAPARGEAKGNGREHR